VVLPIFCLFPAYFLPISWPFSDYYICLPL